MPLKNLKPIFDRITKVSRSKKLSLGIVLFIVLAILVFRKPIAALMLEKVLFHYTEAQSEVVLSGLGLFGARLSIEVPSKQITIDKVQIEWGPGSLFTGNFLVAIPQDGKVYLGKYLGLRSPSIEGTANIKSFQLDKIDLNYSEKDLGQKKYRLDRFSANFVYEHSKLELRITSWDAKETQVGQLHFISDVKKDLKSGEGKLELSYDLADFKKNIGDTFTLFIQWDHTPQSTKVTMAPFQTRLFKTQSPLITTYSKDLWELESDANGKRPSVLGFGKYEGTQIGSLKAKQLPTPQIPTVEVTLETVQTPAEDRLLQMDQLIAKLSFQNGIQSQWTVNGLQEVSEDPSLYPLGMRIKAAGPLNAIKLEGNFLDLIDTEILKWKGKANARSGEMRLSMNEMLDFAALEIDPSQITTEFDQEFKPKRGTLKVNGNFQRSPQGKSSMGLSWNADKLSFEINGIPFAGLSGGGKWGTKEAEASRPRIRIDAIGSELPLRGIEVEGFLTASQTLKVTKAVGEWAEGSIELSPFEMKLSPIEFRTVVKIDDLNLDRILKGAKVETLKGYGTLSGKLPIQYKNGYLIIEQGVLSNQGEEGWIRYDRKDLTPEGKIEYLKQFEALMAMGQQALIAKALDNFYYNKLEAKIRRNPEKGLEAKLVIAGKNPDLGNGMPFQFNIGLTGQVESAVKQSLLRAFMQPEAFSDMLRAEP